MEKMLSRVAAMASSQRELTARLLSPQAFLQLAADEVERAGRYDRPLSVALVLVDDIQEFRKADGLDTAEFIFADITARVMHSLRGPDRTGRLGPGQLGILMPETTLKQAGVAVDRLRETIFETPVETPAGARSVTICAGVAAMSTRTRDAKAFLMTACYELRRAQTAGRNCVCVARPEVASMTIPRSGQVH